MPQNTVLECEVPMRDGIKLYTTIQLPEPVGKFPVIIFRSPYLSVEKDLDRLREQDTHGYAYLTQHCRGTALSQGECNAYLNERNDGLDLLEWVRKQPFYNGEIYLFGASYQASVHFAYLDTNPPDVKAAYLAVQDTCRYNICYRNGFFKANLHGRWVMNMHKKNQAVERNVTKDTFRTMPLVNITECIFNETVPYIENIFIHPDPLDPYWNTPEGGSDYNNACCKCSIPILLVTAFYDIYTGGVFDMWESLSPRRRENCALLVTPFEHNYDPVPAAVPEEMRDFHDGFLKNIFPDLPYSWFDHFRKGSKLPLDVKGKMAYYRLWDHRWITKEDLINAPDEKIFYLRDDRSLQPAPCAQGSITYTYNPYSPAEFPGGVCNNFGGMRFQDPPNSRHDIISFLSGPLQEDMICEGRIELELCCSSTAEDSCFYVRLDLERNGRAVPLRDDIDSLCRLEKDYTPGEERLFKYTFAPHAFKMLKGDRLRLDVSSSCVPHFHVHTNHKGIQALQTTAKSCRNTIHTGKSFIRLFTGEKN